MRQEKLNRRTKRLLAALATTLIAAVFGWMLLSLNLGQGIRNAAYDLPFLFQQRPPPASIVLVYLDEFSHQELDQPLSRPWDRKLHARLVDRLAEAGAGAIVFDILFHDSFPDKDVVFAESIHSHGKVVLAGEIVRSEVTGGINETLLLAAPDLRRAAAGYGLTDIPIDADGVMRSVRHRIPTPFGERPSLSWKSYETARPEAPPVDPSDGAGLIDYYGPAGSFPGYSYSAVLDPERLPDSVFKGKTVLVGARQKAGLAASGKDTFPTPYTLVTHELMPGVEIHASLLANLVENRTLRSATDAANLALVVLSALLLGVMGCLLPPARGIGLCIAFAVLVAVTGILLHRQSGTIYLWTIPSLAQMPVAVLLALGAHYLIEYAARWRLRHAFKSYMSDEQARQIDDEEVSLELGGKEVEATILFSDLAGFTSMSEGLPPQSVSKALISYFESATEGILDNQGTIIKYVGDAVMATWGAPLKVDREADRAIGAAIQMQVAGTRPITLETEDGLREQVLETRIGINRGLGLAGNLGSRRRFDYSVIGDTTNLAARLEGMNKMLGTSILVTRAVLDACEHPGRYLKREMGAFVVKGRKQAVEVFEIYGYTEKPADAVRQRDADYLRHYADGLKAFRRQDWSAAREAFDFCLGRHDRLPEDPAARLFLEAVERCADDPPEEEDWAGSIVLDSK